METDKIKELELELEKANSRIESLESEIKTLKFKCDDEFSYIRHEIDKLRYDYS